MFKSPVFKVTLLATAIVGAITTPFLSFASDYNPPNVVLILVDDMGFDLGTYGHPVNKTPVLDGLANTGQKWNSFYVASGVCSPSRGALLTGRHPVTTGMYGKNSFVSPENDPYGFPNTEISLAKGLQDLGYKTGIVGKWHLGDTEKAIPTKHGFDYWYGITMSNDAYKTYTLDLVQSEQARISGDKEALSERNRKVKDANHNPKEEYWDQPIYEGYAHTKLRVVQSPAIQRDLTKNFVTKSMEFITKNKNNAFFLYVPLTNPHAPLFPGQGFEGTTDGGPYGDSIAELDYSVGEIVKHLEKENLRDNTLIIFLSDNGPWLPYQDKAGNNGFFHSSKGSTYEGGVRVPAIFNWPGQIESKVVYDIGNAMDIYPTVINLAGGELSKDRDYHGFDITNTLLDGEKTSRDFNAYYFKGELKAYRKGSYKLHFDTVNFLNPQPYEKNNIRLFNINIDTKEQWDISYKYPEIVADLTKEAKAYDSKIHKAEPMFDRYIFEVIAREEAAAKANKT
ncbi:arylsulfatase [Photobacterium kishitanii]|uniref:sulfatase-like hydrolase/transferase n=1 Tax=Photobacterium kishitanii TaxID=318456 RepID=UPI000D16B878|nr:sulfatase-like hydrolase/transferase [Photobacterium kishitanii]PSV16509.1 arylsulfatase [Photobacterium kishitanii]